MSKELQQKEEKEMKAIPVYTYKDLSVRSQGWINDLDGNSVETGFPDIDPAKMSESDVAQLADYLDSDDGSLSEEDMEFSRDVAEEVRGLTQ